MLNNKPTGVKKKDGTQKYKQGNYIPINSSKVIKLNSEGGIYYRSGYELKTYKYLDMNEDIIQWGVEFIAIPYKKTEVKKASDGIMDYKTTSHNYYPDVWYKIKRSDGSIDEVLMEIKPYSETIPPKQPAFNATSKQLENFEYAMKLWNANMYKWEAAERFCKDRGIKFVILTEAYLKMLKN